LIYLPGLAVFIWHFIGWVESAFLRPKKKNTQDGLMKLTIKEYRPVSLQAQAFSTMTF